MMNQDLYLTPYTNTNSRWTAGLNEKAKTTRLIEYSRKYLHDLEVGKDFSNTSLLTTVKKN
jgi:hypothetical protein